MSDPTLSDIDSKKWLGSELPLKCNLGETNYPSIGGVRSNEKRGGRYRPAGRTRALEVFGSAFQFVSWTAQASQGTDNRIQALPLKF